MIGVSTTVGGKRTGLRALCAAYATATVPEVSEEGVTERESLERRVVMGTPAETARFQSVKETRERGIEVAR